MERGRPQKTKLTKQSKSLLLPRFRNAARQFVHMLLFLVKGAPIKG